MALLQVNFLSNTLKRTVPMTVILPVDKLVAGNAAPEGTRYKTLYLLHGYLGNCTDWLCNTRIQQWAEAKDLAVVMPSGDNAFYVDQPVADNDYGAFIGQELVEITRKMFPLSHRREDTFIAGLSMGGYGAIRNGLKYGETFGYAAGFSGAFHYFEHGEGEGPKRRSHVLTFPGAELTDKNPRVLLEDRLARGLAVPEIYLSCGTQDALLDSNYRIRDFFLEKGLRVTWSESQGGHEWDFWNREIQALLRWLPLGTDTQGLGSGNING